MKKVILVAGGKNVDSIAKLLRKHAKVEIVEQFEDLPDYVSDEIIRVQPKLGEDKLPVFDVYMTNFLKPHKKRIKVFGMMEYYKKKIQPKRVHRGRFYHRRRNKRNI